MFSVGRRLGAFCATLSLALIILSQAIGIVPAFCADQGPVSRQTDGVVSTEGTPVSTPAPGVLFLGMTGITPSDMNLESNGLGQKLHSFTFSALSTRSFRVYTCPTEGWMQLRATGDITDVVGRRMADTIGLQCLGMKPMYPDGGYVATPVDISAMSTEANDFLADKPVAYSQFDLRTEKIHWPATGFFATDAWAVGKNSGLALANKSGEVAHWLPLPITADPVTLNKVVIRNNPESGPDVLATPEAESSDPNQAEESANQVAAVAQLETIWSRILKAAPSDVVVDLDPVDTALWKQQNTETVKAIVLQQLAAVLEANQQSESPRPVIIASVGDAAKVRSLQFLATNIPGLSSAAVSHSSGSPLPEAAVLNTSTTRASGLATLADVRGLILQGRKSLQPELKIPKGYTIPELSTSPVEHPGEALDIIIEQQRHAGAALLANSNWYRVFHFGFYLTLAVLVIWIIKGNSSVRFRRKWWVVRLFGLLTFAMLPAALILNFIPWWNFPGADTSSGATLAALGLTAVITVILVGSLWRSRFPVSILAGISLLILVFDVILGSAHQRNGFMGSLVLSSRRYYGISNRTYAILIVCALFAVIPVMERYWGKRLAAGVVAGLGLVILAVDALPDWGADFGGPPGIILAFGLVALLAAGIRPRWWHLGIWILASAAVMGVIAWLSRGSDSHIGNFWANLGSSESKTLVAGKIRDVLRSFANNLTMVIILLLFIVVLLVIGFILRRRDLPKPQWWLDFDHITESPGFRAVAVGILAGIFVAVPINDSGMMMVKEMLYLVLPAIAAIIAGYAQVLASNPRNAPDTSQLYPRKPL